MLALLSAGRLHAQDQEVLGSFYVCEANHALLLVWGYKGGVRHGRVGLLLAAFWFLPVEPCDDSRFLAGFCQPAGRRYLG